MTSRATITSAKNVLPINTTQSFKIMRTPTIQTSARLPVRHRTPATMTSR